MRIAQVSPVWLETPPQSYGGTERIVSLLTEELVKRGHEVTLFATADSKTKAKLVPIWPRGLFADTNVLHTAAVFGLLYKELLEQQGEFDIIHDHCEYNTAPFSKFLKPPIVTTLHNMLTEESTILYKKFPNINYVAISENQKKSGPGINIVKTIYHGIPVKEYKFNSKPQDYLVWLSNITPEKGLAEAIEIAKMAGEKLIISGTIFPRHADYFEHRIKPLIDGKQIQFVGASDDRKKIELFGGAKAFLFPIFKWQEPFGLVVIESMACGTPVVAARSGSMPELIEHGKTGFLVDSATGAVSALKRIKSISRNYCQEYVKKNFPLEKMVDQYEQLYKEILSRAEQ
ncbi:MAG TPA: glycosyltransferase family 4 protein [Candidatus Wildermuthbacteria bacterium]|nr:glycosyltransferase family 4 protein [Candidatus Wildermuthbacteria bacterium]